MNDYLKAIISKLLVSILAISLVAVPAAIASDSERHQQVNDMNIYLGVVPSQLAASNHPEMHGINESSRHVYHVLIALFDSETGDRIKDAKVKATVSASALAEEHKVLEVMQTNGAISFGNFFNMPVPGQYRIEVEIQHSKMHGTAITNFVYQRPRD